MKRKVKTRKIEPILSDLEVIDARLDDLLKKSYRGRMDQIRAERTKISEKLRELRATLSSNDWASPWG